MAAAELTYYEKRAYNRLLEAMPTPVAGALALLFPSTGNAGVVEYTASTGALVLSDTDVDDGEIFYHITTDTSLAVTLPTPEPPAGQVIHFKDVSGGASGNPITISATNLIDGDNVSIVGNYAAVCIQSRGPGNGYAIAG